MTLIQILAFPAINSCRGVESESVQPLYGHRERCIHKSLTSASIAESLGMAMNLDPRRPLLVRQPSATSHSVVVEARTGCSVHRFIDGRQEHRCFDHLRLYWRYDVGSPIEQVVERKHSPCRGTFGDSQGTRLTNDPVTRYAPKKRRDARIVDLAQTTALGIRSSKRPF